MQRLLLDVREVALMLHLSRSYVYQLIEQGELVAVKFGNAVRIHPQDLEAYISRRREAHRTRSEILPEYYGT